MLFYDSLCYNRPGSPLVFLNWEWKLMKATINGIEIFWLEEGRGNPLVLLHGFPFTAAMWGPQLVNFSRKFRVIVPDLRGFGKTTKGEEEATSMELMADDLAGLLDHLKLKKAVIVGFSMGGYIAFSFYRKYPDRTQALVLCDTRSEADSEEVRSARYQLIEKIKETGQRSAADGLVPRLFGPQTYRQQQEMVAHLAGLIERNNPAGTIAAARGMAERPEFNFLLKEIKVPTLVMVGKEDLIASPEGARKMAEQIPDWQFSIIPNAGHMSNLENPFFFNQALETFLRSVYD